MFQKKRYLYLSEAEYSILVKSLVHLKNKLIQQNRYTDCVDELLIKSSPPRSLNTNTYLTAHFSIMYEFFSRI